MGFWGNLLKIGSIAAAPFTGGTSLAFLPAALGAGGALLDAFGNRKKAAGVAGGSPGASFGADFSKVDAATGQQQANVNAVNAGANASEAMSQNALRPSLGYYNRLLSGDRTEGMRAIAPEVGTILDQYDTARKTVAQNQGRGGGQTRLLAMLPFQKQGTIQNLLFGARRDAAEKLAGLGTTLGQQATTRYGQGLQGQQGIIGTELDKQRQTLAGQLGLLQAQADQYKRDKDMGSALGGFINSILLGLPIGKSGSSKTPSAPAPSFDGELPMVGSFGF